MSKNDMIQQLVDVMTPTDEQFDEIIAAFPKRKNEDQEAYVARLTREAQIFMLQNRLGVGRQTAIAYVKDAEARSGQKG